ncbi:MAG: copper resistance protein B [Gallionella sp.]
MRSKQLKIIPLAVFVYGVTTVGTLSAIAADNMPSMDHSQMNHAAQVPASDMQGMDHESGKEAGTLLMQGGAAPADARDPHAYSDGYDFGPIPPPRMADQAYMGALLANRLERAQGNNNSLTMYALQGMIGRDYDRLVIKAEGDVAQGKLQDGRTELLWSHATTTFWDAQLGVRYDSGIAPDQQWLALGVQGLAPYWFEVDATAYIGKQGRTALRLEAEYELLITQKLILQPRVEINLYGKNDAARDIGSGLSDALAGLRLRYEFTRQFSPYAGIEWAGKLGNTAGFVRAAGEKMSETRWVAGVRFWF